jgi:hypothetical protein
MASSSSRLGLDEPSATDSISGFPAEDVQALGVLDNAALYLTGTLAARSSVSPLVTGLLYRASDTGDYSVYNGSGWDNLVRGVAQPLAITLGSNVLSMPANSNESNELTVTHGLGRTPTLIIPTGAFPYTFIDIIQYAATNYTPTQFNLYAYTQNPPSSTGATALGCTWIAVG